MKKKLNILFILVSLSLLGIIVFQVYWSVSAYSVNKTKFDTDVDVAMQKAMDDCKKDYFDSIRVVMVKRLSDTASIKIKVDGVKKIHEIIYMFLVFSIFRRTLLVAPKKSPKFSLVKNELIYYVHFLKFNL